MSIYLRSKRNVRRLVAVGLVLLALGLPSAARAESALDEGLSKLASNIAAFLEEEGLGKSISVGDFIAPPRLEASGGRGLSEAIAAAFKKQGIEVRRDAPVQLMGRFTVRQEKQSDRDSFESVALRLRAEVLDKLDDVLQAYNISVFGSAALQIAGGTADLPPGEELERQQETKERIEDPQAALVGAETRASASSRFGVELVVASQPRVPELVGGRSFVSLHRGEEYAIRLHNHGDIEVAVELTIDGLNMFAFSKEENVGSRVLVAANSFVEIPGWYLTGEQSGALVITGYPESAAGLRGVTTRVGTITATFAASWDPRAKPPADEPAARSAGPATGIGREIEKKYVSVPRHVGQPRAVVSVRYRR